MHDPLDLSGQWQGTYTYPGNAAPMTPFIANIAEIAGSFTGWIMEPDMFYGQDALEAQINGHRQGRSVDFTKVYRRAATGYENPVDYVGSVSADGLLITGVWSLLHMDGTFEMVRDAATEQIAEKQVSSAVPVSN